MSNALATRLRDVAPSASMAALAEVARLRQEGREILALTVGEPDFPTPPHIIEAAVAALRAGETGYRPTNGIPALRTAIRARFAAGGLLYAQDEVTIGAGAKQLIFAAFAATINAGDEVIVPIPYWVSYPDIAKLFGAKIVYAQGEVATGFKLTPNTLRQALSPQTRWLVINSPNNPTGAVYSSAELAALGAVLQDFPNCLVLSDEIYEHLVYDGGLFTPFAVAAASVRQRVLTVNGVSKAYSMTGFRLGYAGGPAWLVAGLNTILTQDTTCPSSISQLAAVAALTGDQSSVSSNRREYEARRDRFVARLNQIPGMACLRPGGAFYAFASVEALLGAVTPAGEILGDDLDVSRYLLRQAHVATMAGAAFGQPGYLRFSFATSSEVLERAGDAMAAALGHLQRPSGP